MTMTPNRGFTLIELAMVLFILALILGGVLAPLSTKLELDERTKTAKLLDEARSSLIGYAVVNGHLPCPDCPNNSITANCGAVQTALRGGAVSGFLSVVEEVMDKEKIPAGYRFYIKRYFQLIKPQE